MAGEIINLRASEVQETAVSREPEYAEEWRKIYALAATHAEANVPLGEALREMRTLSPERSQLPQPLGGVALQMRRSS